MGYGAAYMFHLLYLGVQLESFKDSLRTAERVAIQNTYQQKQAMYRKAPVLKGVYIIIIQYCVSTLLIKHIYNGA